MHPTEGAETLAGRGNLLRTVQGVVGTGLRAQVRLVAVLHSRVAAGDCLADHRRLDETVWMLVLDVRAGGSVAKGAS